MKKSKLSKDEIKKLMLSAIGFVALIYVYVTFFLGPLNRSRASMLAQMENLQEKIGSSKSEMMKANTLERQASNATSRHDALKALTPEGAPIAWFPPRMKSFFGGEGVDKVSARLENNSAFKEPELSNWMKDTWVIDIPQVDFASLGKALADLENAEPLIAVTKINIKSSTELPEFQTVTLAATTTLLKR